MPSKKEQFQQIWHRYDSRQDHKPSSLRQAVGWAVEEGLLELPEPDPIGDLAEQMGQAIREEYKTDANGRRYRVNHAVRVTKSGVQYTFWGVLGFAKPEHFVKAFGQRRELIVGESFQLKIDVDVFNDLNEGKYPVFQLVLNYTDDVAEREQLMLRHYTRRVA
jgi:hypothetical protein